MSKLRKQAPKEVVEVVEELEAVEVTETVEVAEPTKAEEVSVIDKAVKTAETVVEKVTEVKEEPKVRINPKQDIRTFIGDQWYNLKAGKQVSVPRTVKEKLQKAGLLNPL